MTLVVPSQYSLFFERMILDEFLQVLRVVRLHRAHYIKNDLEILSLHHPSLSNMLLKTSLGPLQLAFARGAGFVGLFSKEGFSSGGGNHQHLVLLLNHHHYRWLVDLRAGCQSASLQLQLSSRFNTSQRAQALCCSIQAFLGEPLCFTEQANWELSLKIVDGKSSTRMNQGQLPHSPANLHLPVSFLLLMVGFCAECCHTTSLPPRPSCQHCKMCSSSYWLFPKGGWCTHALSHFLSFQSSGQGHQYT